jgi:addiction module HigA family antidote
MLLEEFLKPNKMTQTALAEKMGVPIQRVNTIVSGKRGISAETAILLAGVFGNSPQFWMGIQMDYDLWNAQHKRRSSAP